MKNLENYLYSLHQLLSLWCLAIGSLYGYISFPSNFEAGYSEGTHLLLWLYGALTLTFIVLNFLCLPFSKPVDKLNTWIKTSEGMGRMVDFIIRDGALMLGAVVLSLALYIGDDMRSTIPVAIIGIAFIAYGVLPPLPQSNASDKLTT